MDKPDIIVVGAGLAGICAVVVIDRASSGGSLTISGGVSYVQGGYKAAELGEIRRRSGRHVPLPPARGLVAPWVRSP